jgi:DNA polymerase V
MLVIDRHSVQASKYYFNMAVTLPFATNSTLTISNTAIDMLKKLYKGNENIKFKKAGVIVTELIDENKKQLQLFDEENPKHLALMQVMDKLNNKIGDKKVKLATQNLSLTWNMNQNHLSPRYTTNFNDILEIRCQ